MKEEKIMKNYDNEDIKVRINKLRRDKAVNKCNYFDLPIAQSNNTPTIQMNISIAIIPPSFLLSCQIQPASS